MRKDTVEDVFRSEALQALDWIEHGFGTRQSGSWPGEYTGAKQVHSDVIVDADRAPFLVPPEGDALVTSKAGRWIGIRTADCVPLLMADVERRFVAAVHAGWRGTASGIAAKTVRRLIETSGSNPASIVVAIGPAVGVCCYEVGPEVAAQFGSSTNRLDLAEINRQQLTDIGVLPSNIDSGSLCTVCDADEFHSWRRDRDASGRMVSAIRIRPLHS
ncbi:MAG TPA: peptidoglycan editing factor PgeF [Bryobacteraceae bacterium]|nr:peptidoglycan editing factor PgeF [Bryobacteraceae bacterium]